MASTTRHFRIYGKDTGGIWKIIWIAQAKGKDIQHSPYVGGGKSYTSIHQDGEIHTTLHTPEGKEYPTKNKRRWTLDTFKLFDILEYGGITKEALKKTPLIKESKVAKEIVFLDLAEFEESLNYWFILIEPKLANVAARQMEKKFPGMKVFIPKSFNPTLLIGVFDPSKCNFGKRMNVLAKENSMQVVLPPDKLSLDFNLEEFPELKIYDSTNKL